MNYTNVPHKCMLRLIMKRRAMELTDYNAMSRQKGFEFFISVTSYNPMWRPTLLAVSAALA